MMGCLWCQKHQSTLKHRPSIQSLMHVCIRRHFVASKDCLNLFIPKYSDEGFQRECLLFYSTTLRPLLSQRNPNTQVWKDYLLAISYPFAASLSPNVGDRRLSPGRSWSST